MTTLIGPNHKWPVKVDPVTVKPALTAAQVKVLFGAATEPRSTTMAKGGFDDCEEKGVYVCAACDNKLYDSSMKFDCG